MNMSRRNDDGDDDGGDDTSRCLIIIPIIIIVMAGLQYQPLPLPLRHALAALSRRL
jgi:hypothetical protein